ncbi:MAG TPA: hypothetical protein VG367_03500 [Mucilaginibacter sp.]|jgi:hypothetical protein|nr:hypothetical protein [Mucilaginibacter sp.]
MNKALYIILIVFLGLGVALGTWSFVIESQIGTEIYQLESYVSWFLEGNSIGVIGSVLLLKYYYDQHYRAAFLTGIIALVANLVYVAVVYINLTSAELVSYSMLVILINLGAIIIYTGSLVFSNARKRHWLKLAGIIGSLTSLILVSIIIGRMYVKDAGLAGTLERIIRWSPYAWYLVDVMFIMNFVAELRALKPKNPAATSQDVLAGVSAVLALFAIICTIATERQLVRENNSHVDWSGVNAADGQQLVGLAGGARTYVDRHGDSLHYILIKPVNYDKQKKYPLVVCLPYGGYVAGAAQMLTNATNRYTYPAFIFVPWCPDGEGWGGIPGYPSIESLVYETISTLHDPGIDVKRRYITGVSRGGYGTWEFICTRPDLFAAAVPVCGGGDPGLASKIVNMPVWAFHGKNDRNVPVSGSRNMISAIKKAGGHPLYTEYRYGTHDIWENVVETPEVWSWLFAQKQK